MAPEQGFGHADARSDVYALGVIYYEMVTGRKPYQADTPMAIMLKKNTEPLPRPTLYVPNLPASVENVLIKALARDPIQRYKDMGALASALETLIGQKTAPMPDTMSGTITFEDGPGLSSFTTQDEEAAHADRKSWISWGIGGIVLVSCCVVALGSLMVGRFLASPPSTPTESSFPTSASTEAPSDLFVPSPVSEIPSPTQAFINTPTSYGTLTVPSTSTEPPSQQPSGGTWIAFNSKMSGNANIYIVDINGDNLTELTTSTAHDLYPSWSPDGSQIVYQTNEGGDQELAILDIATKNSRKLTSNVCEDWGPSWSPDGDWIAFYSDCNGERDVYKIQTNGNGRQQLTYSSGAYSWFPAWSPDGAKITFSSNRSDGFHIYAMNADGSNQSQLARGCVSYFSPDGSQILYGVYCDDTDDLWIMNSDGSNQHQITDGCECKNAAWSPDGTKIVFEKSLSGKDGPFGIFIMSLSNPQPSNWIQITSYEINGRTPIWQP